MKMKFHKGGDCILQGILLILSISSTIDCVWADDENSTSPEVTTTQGTLNGLNLVTNGGREIAGFLGIPYAESPTGNLRFASPVSLDSWEGTLNATVESKLCPQIDFVTGGLLGDEDCLQLNVYTPQLPSAENCILLPVMVWIFGGSFMLGNTKSSTYGPGYLLDEDVVLVVPNYRVGALGFLSTGDEESPGNYGLKDVVAALEWIQTNIEYFGGDPSQVTIVGQSSGAATVHLLTMSDLATGLFHRYITQSGSAFAPWAYRPRTLYAERATQLGENLGCSTSTSASLIECLRALNASEIVTGTSQLYIWEGFPEVLWGPTDEPDIEGAFLTDSPRNLLAAGKSSSLPWMSGVTRDEGTSTSAAFYENSELFDYFLANISTVLPYMLEYYDDVDNVSAVTAALKAEYFEDVTANASVLLANLTDVMSDGSMFYPQYEAIQQQLAADGTAPFVYTFEYRGTFSYSYYWSGGDTADFGVTHGDDVIYLFPESNSVFRSLGKTMSETDLEMVKIMVQLWTSFATTGIPTTSALSEEITWEPYTACSNNYLRIGNNSDLTLEVGSYFHEERMEFWDELTTDTCFA